MKAVGYIAAAVGLLVAGYLLAALGVLDKVDGMPGTQEDPVFSLPTYLSFLSVVMTAVSVVLTALAIGIGVVAAYTFRGVHEAVQVSLAERAAESERKLSAALRGIQEQAAEAVAEALRKSREDRFGAAARPSVDELEKDFDKEDDGNR